MSTLPSRLKSARAIPRPCWWGSSTPREKGQDPSGQSPCGLHEHSPVRAPGRATREGAHCTVPVQLGQVGRRLRRGVGSGAAGHLVAAGTRDLSSVCICPASTLFLLSVEVAWVGGRSQVEGLEDERPLQPPDSATRVC